ncbi:MAG: hypothetical protein QRY72_03380 [Candidatus Rhabdochlamydia sp.]
MLGDLLISPRLFLQTESLIQQFKTPIFAQLSPLEQEHQVCKQLLEAILQEDKDSFALIPTLHFIDQIVSENILPSFHFLRFERWLDHDSHLSFEDNLYVRGKIAGRWIPRHCYQKLFPLGEGKMYPGPHFVTAHASPDVDTTIASFWGWVDAFAARVGSKGHIWNVPGDTPPEHLEISLLFTSLFGKNLFSRLAQNQTKLAVTAKDLYHEDTREGDLWQVPAATLPMSASLEEVQAVLKTHPCVHIVHKEEDNLVILGVIEAQDVQKTPLGTVSLRDFSNREETYIPPYLDVISVMDHHKSHLVTTRACMIWVTDAQSCNVLVAESSNLLSEGVATSGMTLDATLNQMQMLLSTSLTPSSCRLLQRVVQKLKVFQRSSAYFVSPEREQFEALCYLYAILDDTDLLSKATYQDVICVAAVFNKLKSLSEKKEVELIHFDDLKEDETFVKNGVERLLNHEEMISLYHKIDVLKEQGVTDQLRLAAEGNMSYLWSDTKEQNGCCRVGQTKIFPGNIPTLWENHTALYQRWQEMAKLSFSHHSQLTLHLQMMSTLAGSKRGHGEEGAVYTHFDELWIWAPSTPKGLECLKTFLKQFLSSPAVTKLQIEGSCFSQELAHILHQEYPHLIIRESQEDKGCEGMILRYPAGSLNSRKAAISPYLPSC